MNKNERQILCIPCRKKLNKIEAINKAEYRKRLKVKKQIGDKSKTHQKNRIKPS